MIISACCSNVKVREFCHKMEFIVKKSLCIKISFSFQRLR